MENLRGAMLMMASMAGFALEDTSIKLASANGVPTGQILAILGFLGMLVYWAFMVRKNIPMFSRQLIERGVIVRNLGEFIGTGSYVIAFTTGALSSAAAVQQALPLVVTMGAAIFLGQHVGWRRWIAIGVGFIGVLLVIQPGSANFDPVMILALISMLFMAMRDVQTRAIRDHIHSLQMAAWGFMTIIPLGIVVMIFQGTSPVWPSMLQWGFIIGAVIIGTGAYYLLIAASRIGDMAVITPFRYTRIIFALVIGVLVFGEGDKLNTMMMVGVLIIITSGIYTFYRESRARRASPS